MHTTVRRCFIDALSLFMEKTGCELCVSIAVGQLSFFLFTEIKGEDKAENGDEKIQPDGREFNRTFVLFEGFVMCCTPETSSLERF